MSAIIQCGGSDSVIQSSEMTLLLAAVTCQSSDSESRVGRDRIHMRTERGNVIYDFPDTELFCIAY